jgi:redox-sensitive bicupin YhaK (pirin superfamily)
MFAQCHGEPTKRSTSNSTSGVLGPRGLGRQGPIVMNTQEELRIAFEELDRGPFIKKK